MRTGGVRGKERLGILPTDHTGRKGDKVISNATHFNKSPPSNVMSMDCTKCNFLIANAICS